MHFPFVATWAGVPALIVAVFIVVLARRGRPSHRRLTRGEEWIIGLVGTGAILVTLGNIAALIFQAFHVFRAPELLVDRFFVGNAPEPTFAARSTAIVDAHYETVGLTVRGLPADARWMLFLEIALPALSALALSVGVAWLAILILRGKPFLTSTPPLIGVAAAAVLVGGLGAQICGSAARSAVVTFLDPRIITAGDRGDGPYEGLSQGLNLDGAPIGWALALTLLAVAFRIGTRLQKDTEGLV